MFSLFGRRYFLILNKLIRFNSNGAEWNIIPESNTLSDRIMVSKRIKDAGVLAKILGITHLEANEIFKTQRFEMCEQDDVLKSYKKLRELNFRNGVIVQTPTILLHSYLTLENRYKILEECGFEKITINVLNKYVIYMNKKINMLKLHNYLAPEGNVTNTLLRHLDVPIKFKMPIGDDVSLNELRKILLLSYLKERLHMNTKDQERILKTYPRMKHKSFYTITRILRMLENDFNMPKDRILKNGFLLHADPDNIQKILKEIPNMGGHDIREICYRRPKIMMSTCDCLKSTLQHIRDFGIPETAISRCLEVMTLGSNTVLERLRDLETVPEFDVLANNPRILRLIHYKNKAITRLDYLRQIKVKCASLHILSSHSEAFEKYARIGNDRTKGSDITNYLIPQFGRSDTEIRLAISRHPNWCHVPIVSVKQSLEYLKGFGFNVDDIFHNIHLILYPIARIESNLKIIDSNKLNNDQSSSIDWENITNSERLGLCLYMIEQEFHFTGDGIWTDHAPNQPDVLLHPIPEFPGNEFKQYRFGMKPSTSSSAIPSTS